jgi:hypothetical protein
MIQIQFASSVATFHTCKKSYTNLGQLREEMCLRSVGMEPDWLSRKRQIHHPAGVSRDVTTLGANHLVQTRCIRSGFWPNADGRHGLLRR